MSERSSPVILPLCTRLGILLGATVFNSALYFVINAYPTSQPKTLARNWLDSALGWHPWTVWPYWLLLLMGPLMALGVSQRQLFFAMLRAYAVAIACNATIWLLWPTMIERAPIPRDLDAFTTGAWRLLRALDLPNNCLPSGHITIPIVLAVGYSAQHPHARRWLGPLLIVLVPSVVTTGQHYSWDIFAGVATAMIGLLVAGRPLWAKPLRLE